MVDPALETSREVLQERAGVQLDHYQDLAERMQSPLATMAVEKAIESAMLEHKQNELNQEMLDMAVAALPSESEGSFTISHKDPGQARRIQASAIWLPETAYGGGPAGSTYMISNPHYVIGAAPSAHKGWTELLIERAATKSGHVGGLKLIAVPNDFRDTFEEASGKLDTEYTKEELDKILKVKDKLIVIDGGSPGSIIIDKLLEEKGDIETKTRWLKRMRARHSLKGEVGAINLYDSFYERPRLTNDDLAKFDVISRLADLSILFGKVDEIDEVFAQRLAGEKAALEEIKHTQD